MKSHKHSKDARKTKVLSVKDIKVCFGKCRCFSAGGSKKKKF